ncbi:TPA: DUF3862 domain-containing protein [Bacillus anthracis]|nr:DUF3862 domain-containing protein [Bacillus cereus]HDR7436686.1 DUF3862 domain-containing protein [Bacillus anthracis]
MINSNRRIIKAKLEQIQNGMSYDDIVTIIGGDGELCSEATAGGYKTSLYTWEGQRWNGSNAKVTFKNGKIMTKAQFGIKWDDRNSVLFILYLMLYNVIY